MSVTMVIDKDFVTLYRPDSHMLIARRGDYWTRVESTLRRIHNDPVAVAGMRRDVIDVRSNVLPW